MAVQQVIVSGGSLRGVEKNFKLGASDSETSTPSFSSIRNWLGRIGLYQLQKEKEYRSDWIFIVDLTIELGKQKCLLVLGVTQEYLSEYVLPFNRGLQHRDVQVLMLEIMDSTKGDLIEEKLSKLTDKVGCPLQIIADHGNDLEKGIKLYTQKNPSVIYTYDVTHAMALILKHELANSERYQSFIQLCNQTRNQLKQTELSFLSPPSQRCQCRYFNVERLIDWAQKIWNCSIDSIADLLPNFEPPFLNQKLNEKFGWLIEYQEEIETWGEMVEMTRTLETYLKTNGINQDSLTSFEFLQSYLDFNVNPSFKQKILDYLIKESCQIPAPITLLATSDIIESIFGKYKQFSSRCPIKQIGQTVLSISLCTMNLTTTVIKQARFYCSIP
ncbi:MAG: hypothetical protein ACFCUV_05665 [Rivularia sp. (in: cyanobacteria)]